MYKVYSVTGKPTLWDPKNGWYKEGETDVVLATDYEELEREVQRLKKAEAYGLRLEERIETFWSPRAIKAEARIEELERDLDDMTGKRDASMEQFLNEMRQRQSRDATIKRLRDLIEYLRPECEDACECLDCREIAAALTEDTHE